MPTVEARRTLVKSAPELWAELSDADALGRRLEPLGEIRITRLEPQTTVAWEGERTRGTVRIEPCGLGTRVTLTAECSNPTPPPAAPEPPPAPPEPEIPARESSITSPGRPLAAPAMAASPAPSAPPPDPDEAAPEPDEATPEPLLQTTAALGQVFDTPAPQQRPGRALGRSWLLDRLTRRRRWGSAPELPESALPTAPEPPIVEPAPEAPIVEPAPKPPIVEPPPEPPIVEPPPEPAPLPEPAQAEPPELEIVPVPDEPDAGDGQPEEEAAGLEGEALDELRAGVLDDLGAAHHRPFSRG